MVSFCTFWSHEEAAAETVGNPVERSSQTVLMRGNNITPVLKRHNREERRMVNRGFVSDKFRVISGVRLRSCEIPVNTEAMVC